MTRCLQIAAFCGLLGLGCGGKSAPPATGSTVSTASNGDAPAPDEAEPTPTPDTVATAVSAGMDMLESVGAAIADGADCPARAESLRAWHAANGAVIADVSARLRAFPEDQVQAEVEAQMPQREPVVALFQTAQECLDDPAFADAWEETSAAFDQ